MTIDQHDLPGRPTGGKPINLSQLQDEATTAGVDTSHGIGANEDWVYTYDDAGNMADFQEDQRDLMDQVIAGHIALRDKTNEEYLAEFDDPGTEDTRRIYINSIINGLREREQVPM